MKLRHKSCRSLPKKNFFSKFLDFPSVLHYKIVGSYEQTTNSFCHLKRIHFDQKDNTDYLQQQDPLNENFILWNLKVLENVLPIIINQSVFAINSAILMVKIFFDTFLHLSIFSTSSTSFIDKLYVYVNIAMLRVFRPEQESKK